MSDHTMERCWKIHGYPANHKFAKGRKVAALTHNDDNEETFQATFSKGAIL